ncbi:hypothetical protein Tco_0365759 [Tanacetum coccineum]
MFRNSTCRVGGIPGKSLGKLQEILEQCHIFKSFPFDCLRLGCGDICYVCVTSLRGISRRYEFCITAFKSRIVILQTALDHDYNVKLADGRIVGLNTIIRGCTLNFLNHPFNIDLMPVELDEDKSKGKRLEDVAVVQEFLKFFLGLAGYTPLGQVEFSNPNLVLVLNMLARVPYRLATSELKELGSNTCGTYGQRLHKTKFFNPGEARFWYNSLRHEIECREEGSEHEGWALVMTIGLDLPKQILEAQMKHKRSENIKTGGCGGYVELRIQKIQR